MINTLSKRQRHTLLTAIIAAVLSAAFFTTFWLFSKPEAPYSPGEDIEGITADLARSLPKDYPKVTFLDASKEAGIHFQHFSGRRSTQLPEDMGSGAAWVDYDNDGWLDLFVANEVGPLTMNVDEVKTSPAHSMLYHNNGNAGKPGQAVTFTEVSAQAGVDYRGWAIAPAWGDYNNDGLPDLFISCYGENVFYKNNGDGTFTDITREAKLGGLAGFWTGASWADFNRDGWLDLYVCGYVRYVYEDPGKVELQYNVEVPASINPSSFAPERNLFYKNNGDGTFSEIAEKAGVANQKGRSLTAAWCDFDEDGWPDLYVANDVSDNTFFRNLEGKTFEDISHAAWVADYRGAMGIAIGDWDQDQDMDMFVTHWIAQENALYDNLLTQVKSLDVKSATPVRFMDEADRFGLGQIALDYIGWGTSFFDYDNDGWLDLFVVNGSTFQQKEEPWLLEPMPDQLFWNRGAENGFYDVSVVSGKIFRQKFVGRGAAFGDYDNDGDIDIFILNLGGAGRLLRNEGGNKNNWLKIKLTGTRSNRQAFGAKLRLVVGDAVYVRQIGVQGSYCSQNSLIEHFGLNTQTQADTLQITWPSGVQQQLLNLQGNRLVEIKEGVEPRK